MKAEVQAHNETVKGSIVKFAKSMKLHNPEPVKPVAKAEEKPKESAPAAKKAEDKPKDQKPAAPKVEEKKDVK